MTQPITAETLPGFLRERGVIGPEPARVTPTRFEGRDGLAVDAGGKSLDVWFGSPEAVAAEFRAIGLARPVVPDGNALAVFLFDPSAGVLAMERPAAGSRTWAELLAEGRAGTDIAAAAGGMLADIHNIGHRRPGVRAMLPVREGPRAVTMVQGNYGPRTLTVAAARLLPRDYRRAGWGDPSDDAADAVAGIAAAVGTGDPAGHVAAFWAGYNNRIDGPAVAADESAVVRGAARRLGRAVPEPATLGGLCSSLT
jgi:hypothetical protein